MLTWKILVGAWGTACWHFEDHSEAGGEQVQAWGQEQSDPDDIWSHLLSIFCRQRTTLPQFPTHLGGSGRPVGPSPQLSVWHLIQQVWSPQAQPWSVYDRKWQIGSAVTLIEKALKLGYRIARLLTYQALKLYEGVSSVGETGFIPWHCSSWLAMGALCWQRCLGWVWAHSSQPRAILSPRRHVTEMSRDIFGCHDWGGVR